jgi:hypothetical protein
MTNKFRVGGIDYTVELVPQLVERHNLYGQVTYKDSHIQIDDSLSLTRTNEVIIHELTHAIFNEAGYVEQDEEMVRRIASVLHQVLRDNDFGFVQVRDDGKDGDVA